MKTIGEITATYGLAFDEKSALDSTIYAYTEKRITALTLRSYATKAMTNAATTEATGLDNLDKRIERVLLYFRRYMRENRTT